MAQSSFDLPDPYATADDLAAYWRVLTQDERARATNLLTWAAQGIKELPGSDDFDPVTCAQISMDSVKRALLSRGDGVTSVDQSMSDMSANIRYINPTGNLYLTGQEMARLYKQFDGTAVSLTLTSNVRVPCEPWNNQPSSQTDVST